jgi:hypothetical protein
MKSPVFKLFALLLFATVALQGCLVEQRQSRHQRDEQKQHDRDHDNHYQNNNRN